MARSSKAPEERRQEIIDTAFRLFVERGYEHTTVRDIVGEIGVAQGLFYYYFKNKEEVFIAISQQFGEDMVSELTQIIAQTSCSPLQRVRACMNTIADFFYSRSAVWRKLPAGLSTQMQERLLQLTRELLEPTLTDLLAQGTEVGEFSVSYPMYTARFILSGFIALAMDPDHPSAEDILVLIRQFVARILGVAENTLAET